MQGSIQQLRQLPKKINVRQRLPVWGLRLVLGIILFTFSELIMWQNPPARNLAEWPVLLVLYICLAAILIDLVVRFQINTAGAILLACAVYGLTVAVILNHSAFDSLDQNPYRLIVRGLGLQTAAGLYGFLLFIAVMRGRQIHLLHVVGAVAIGLLWGIWVHWYPIQPRVDWGLVPVESASLYIVLPLIAIGFMLGLAVPNFRFFRETEMELLWWEGIVVGVPLFLTLLVGMIQDLIPFLPLVLFLALGAFMVWVLNYQREGTDPSYWAEVTFAAPNMISYIVLAIAFLITGTLAYSLIDGPDSIIGIVTYWLTFAFGAAVLPLALLLIFWRVFKRETRSVKEELMEDLKKDLEKNIRDASEQ